jgi:hypothetical protein
MSNLSVKLVGVMLAFVVGCGGAEQDATDVAPPSVEVDQSKPAGAYITACHTAYDCQTAFAEGNSMVWNGDGTLTYSSWGVSSCNMYYWTSDGQSGSFPVPPNTTATPGCGSAVTYTFQCQGYSGQYYTQSFTTP